MGFSALEALQAFGAGRQMAMQDRTNRRAEDTYQRQERLRTDLIGAYDTATGRIDQQRGRQAYVNAGDVGGALEFDQQMTAQHGREWTQNKDRIIAAVPYLTGVADEATYQQRLAQAHTDGLDIQGAPPSFDPQWVQGIVTIGTRLQQQEHPQQPTEFQRNYTWLQQNHPQAAENYLTRQTEQSPLTVRNDDGTITIIPRVPQSQTAPDGSGRPERMTPEQLRQQADEAIAAGAPRDAVEAELQRMLGDAGGNASGGFPGTGG